MPSLLCSCVHGARLHVKALTSAAACSRSRCVEVAGRIRLDGRCAAEGKHLFVVLSFAACIALRTQLRPSINVLPHTPCDARRQRTARSSSSACVVLAGVSPLLLIPLCSPCWIVPPPLLTKPDPSLLADSCSPDQAAPGCMVVLRLFQRFNKCRKGRKVSVRCLLCASACMEGTFRVCLVCSATASYSVSASKATCPGRTRCCCNLAHYPGNLPLRR